MKKYWERQYKNMPKDKNAINFFGIWVYQHNIDAFFERLDDDIARGNTELFTEAYFCQLYRIFGMLTNKEKEMIRKLAVLRKYQYNESMDAKKGIIRPAAKKRKRNVYKAANLILNGKHRN